MIRFAFLDKVRRGVVARLGGSVILACFSLSACLLPEPLPLANVAYTELDGSVHQTAEFTGQVTLLHFWATSCAVCVREMPQIVDTHQRFKAQGLQILAVAMQYDPPAYVMQFAQSRQLPFRVAMDHSGALAQGLGPIEGTPTTLVVNRQGLVVRRYVGPLDFEALHAYVRELLAQPDPRLKPA